MKRRVRRSKTDDGKSGDGAGRLLCGAGDAVPVPVSYTHLDDIIICDPEAEYAPRVRRLHGQIIRISPVGSDYINPLDINMNYADEEDPVTDVYKRQV